MKHQSKRSGEKHYNNKTSNSFSRKTIYRKISKFNSRERCEIIYNKKYKKYELIKKLVAPDEYVFYSVLNVGVAMEVGVAASMIARSILTLYNTLKANPVMNSYIAQWKKSGENIIVLQGYDHKHLKYLERESKFTALGKHILYHRWYGSRIMLVLSVFGRKEDVEDTFDGLCYWR